MAEMVNTPAGPVRDGARDTTVHNYWIAPSHVQLPDPDVEAQFWDGVIEWDDLEWSEP